jgi:hypothetical protein
MMGEEAIGNFHFRTTPSFHPKILWFDSGESHDVFIGSNNITRDGLKVNWEAGVFLQGLNSSDDIEYINQIEEYWDLIWDTADPCSSELIERYENRRKKLLDKQSPQFIQEQGDSSTPIHEAKYLWAKIGAVSGGSQNQVDVPLNCSRFFSRSPTAFDIEDKISVTLQYRGSNSMDRSIQGNPNGMTRVNLPTDVKYISGLDEYYVMFENIGRQKYKVTLVPDKEEESGRLGYLMNRSRELGNINEATSGRFYGWL